jgi:hypothetical protein
MAVLLCRCHSLSIPPAGPGSDFTAGPVLAAAAGPGQRAAESSDSAFVTGNESGKKILTSPINASVVPVAWPGPGVNLTPRPCAVH